MANRKAKSVPADIGQYMAAIGARGGKASARNLTAAQRRARAKKAVRAREAKRKGGKR